jgi:long-chain acyl-CoA synthetase
MRSFRDVIDAQARQRPGAPFLLAPEPGTTVTYAELARNARGFAVGLHDEDLPPRAIVAYMLGNGVSAATVFLGAMYGGYVVAPINLLAQDAHLDYVMAHAAPALLFTSTAFAPRVEGAVRRAGAHTEVRTLDPDRWNAKESGAGTLAPIDPATPAMLMYTSGTTGLPRGVLLSHANMIHAGSAVAHAHALAHDDRVLSSLPLYHINGQCIATVSPLVSGGSIVMPHRFSVSQWWMLVERYRPTWLNLVPTIIAYLLNGPDLTPAQRDACRGIRFARSASAPLPPEQHRAFEARFGISVLEAMGLTECASVAFANPLDPRARKIGSPGLPLGLAARVVDSDGATLADGEQGEIELRGDSVMSGYYRAPDETAKTLGADGWMKTGDLGHRDADGFYFITGRRKELIIKGGENIAPREIDEALLRHPAVLEAAAVGVPDPGYGQEILACVVKKAGCDVSEEELRVHCGRELGRFKSPKYFRFVAELPKGASGKVQRLKLAELWR